MSPRMAFSYNVKTNETNNNNDVICMSTAIRLKIVDL